MPQETKVFKVSKHY